MQKILTLSGGAWDDRNSVGNTYSNLFSDGKEYMLSNIYTREAMPNNAVCSEYFRITDKMLLRNLLSPERIGCAFHMDAKREQTSAAQQKERRFISAVHKYGLRFLYGAENVLWRLRGWQNEKLRAFLEQQKPDVIFSFAIPTVQRLLLLEYVKKCSGAKVVLFLVDNVCAEYLATDGRKGKAQAARLNKMLSLADKAYAITPELCRIYGEKFHKAMALLRKGCSFDAPVRAAVNRPLRMVYAGNLLYGRMDTLEQLARTLSRINREKQRITLEIYSGTEISPQDRQRLESPGSCRFCGSRQFDQIRQILTQADLVLHAESFDPKHMEQVRYSFSTKITDALESGSVLAVVGPKGLSSVECARQIDGAVVVDDPAQLEAVLAALAEKPEQLLSRAAAIRAFAAEHYHRETVRTIMLADLQAL